MSPFHSLLPCCAAAVVVVSLTSCSSTPQPVSPEQIAKQSKEEPPDETAVAALEGLPLSVEQRRQVGILLKGLRSELSAADKARHEFVEAIAKAIVAGKLDRGSVDPIIRRLAEAVEQAKPALLSAVNELHGLLQAPERRALIEAIAERREQRQGEAKKALVEALDLTFGQKRALYRGAKDKLSDQREQFDELSEQLSAAAEAFQQADFDAHELTIGKKLRIQPWLEASLIFVQVAIPELTPAQRRTLAAIIRRRLSGRPGEGVAAGNGDR
jgi:hypothetical protein